MCDFCILSRKEGRRLRSRRRVVFLTKRKYVVPVSLGSQTRNRIQIFPTDPKRFLFRLTTILNYFHLILACLPELAKAIESRQRLDSQLQENELVGKVSSNLAFNLLIPLTRSARARDLGIGALGGGCKCIQTYWPGTREARKGRGIDKR